MFLSLPERQTGLKDRCKPSGVFGDVENPNGGKHGQVAAYWRIKINFEAAEHSPNPPNPEVPPPRQAVENNAQCSGHGLPC